jgi:hypothetical protein
MGPDPSLALIHSRVHDDDYEHMGATQVLAPTRPVLALNRRGHNYWSYTSHNSSAILYQTMWITNTLGGCIGIKGPRSRLMTISCS